MGIEVTESLSREVKYSEPSGAAKPDVSLLDLLILVSERKKIVLRVTAVAAVLSVILALVIPKKYAASVMLLPPQQNSPLSAVLSSQLGAMGGMAAVAGGGLGIKNPNDMYVALLKSRTVEDAMVKRFKLMEEYHKRYESDARKRLEDRTTIDGNGKDNLIHLTVEDSDPKRAAELANGYVEEFRDLSEHLAISEASQRRLFFERQLKQAKDNLASAEESLKETEQQKGLIQPDSQARALIESAASIRAQIMAKEVQIKSLETFATGQNAQLVQSEEELQGLRAQLAKLGGSQAGGDEELILSKGRMPQAGLEYVRKLRDVKYYETIFDILARQFEIAKLDEAKEGATIQVVDSAVPPERAAAPRRLYIVLGGIVFGFLIGIGWAISESGLSRLHSDPVTEAKMRRLQKAFSR